jgi:hypothetical protein
MKSLPDTGKWQKRPSNSRRKTACGTLFWIARIFIRKASALLFIAGILKAVRIGLLRPDFQAHAVKAMEGVILKINPDGVVEGVSGGTPIMP